MSPNHPPTIDLNALQDKLDEFVDQSLPDPIPQPDRDIGALAIKTANGNGNAAQYRGSEAPRESAPPPVPRLGADAAENMTRLAKAAANDIRQLGRLALEAGKRVHEECEQMAGDVEANGDTVALHLTGLSQLLADVGMSNRETFRRLLGEVSPSIVPASTPENAHVSKQPAGPEKTIETVPFSKKGRRTD